MPTRLILAILFLFMQAAATMPLISALTVVGGRRGNSWLCLSGGTLLLAFCFFLAIAGPLWLVISYLREVLPYHANLGQMLSPLMQPAGMAWSLALAVWLIGMLCAFLAFQFLRRLPAREKYALAYARLPIVFCLLSSVCFLATFLIVRWPFAGLPQDMEWQRALMAIWRNASAIYFLGFCPAGAFALAAWPVWSNRLSSGQRAVATRWLSFWAMAGALPSTFSNWGITLGATLGDARASAMAQGLRVQFYGLSMFTIAIGCWVYLIWKPDYIHPIAWIALFLLLLKTCLPIIVA